ncbi:uncharacterized protein [Zea mays]|uniref:uncharacterized protein n=1 Tax=Zea mays TaxID=4577 RepID=UPI000220935A|nr:uncharacterized protein LOC109943076 [Zea mays]|eukprot:XP_020401472.1 uncharacterized protein LOC109943076 [Zea mays]
MQAIRTGSHGCCSLRHFVEHDKGAMRREPMWLRELGSRLLREVDGVLFTALIKQRARRARRRRGCCKKSMTRGLLRRESWRHGCCPSRETRAPVICCSVSAGAWERESRGAVRGRRALLLGGHGAGKWRSANGTSTVGRSAAGLLAVDSRGRRHGWSRGTRAQGEASARRGIAGKKEAWPWR